VTDSEQVRPNHFRTAWDVVDYRRVMADHRPSDGIDDWVRKNIDWVVGLLVIAVIVLFVLVWRMDNRIESLGMVLLTGGVQAPPPIPIRGFFPTPPLSIRNRVRAVAPTRILPISSPTAPTATVRASMGLTVRGLARRARSLTTRQEVLWKILEIRSERVR
jgi:hypothetical protein